MPEQMTSPRELMLHELGDVLYAEKTILKVLQQQAKAVKDPELKQGFQRHVDETRQQVTNVEKAFRELGEKPKAEKCPGIEGIKAEREEILGETGKSLRDMVEASSATRVEHYEIAAYTGLITMARQLGEKAVVPLLQENLKQEKAMAGEIERASKRLAKDATLVTA